MSFAIVLVVLCCACAAMAVTTGAAVGSSELDAYAEGKKDASGAIQKQLDAMAVQGGGSVFLPTGKYRLDSAIVVPTGVTLAGTWTTPHLPQQAGGTVLLAYADKGNENGPALIQLQPSSAVTGLTVYYPEQKLPDVIPYPWTIQGEGMHGSVENVTLTNSYKGIDFGTKHNELHYVRNVFGCPLKVGVYLDNCTDVGRVENVHFNPHYWARSVPDTPIPWKELRAYLYDNLIAFDIGFSDWEMMTNTFSFGAHVGYRFRKGANRPTGCNGSFLSIAADWAYRALLVEECNPLGLLIQNGQYVGGKGVDAVVEVAPTNKGIVQLSNCSIWGPLDTAVLINGTGSVSLSQCSFIHWDDSKKDFPAVKAVGGSLILQNCLFMHKGKHIELGENLKTGVIQGNQFRMEERIENKSKGDVKIGANVVRE